MVYLRPRDAAAHSRYTSTLRGETWTAKVSGYLEQTPYAVCRGLRGVEGMHGFWAEYATLCDGLLALTSIPTRTIDFGPGEWDRHLGEALDFLDL